ncbi:MAG: hypothetical protein AAFP76_13045 [Bacteroidota bacterium]
MKTVKRILVALTLLFSLTGYANEIKVITSDDGNVTIAEKNQLVQVSVLNVEKSNYKIFVYSPNGELLYQGKMGSETSLGKAFDFGKAEAGTYRFKLVDSAGKVSTYRFATSS